MWKKHGLSLNQWPAVGRKDHVPPLGEYNVVQCHKIRSVHSEDAFFRVHYMANSDYYQYTYLVIITDLGVEE